MIFARFDIHALNESAPQDEEGIKSAAHKGSNNNSTISSSGFALIFQSIDVITHFLVSSFGVIVYFDRSDVV